MNPRPRIGRVNDCCLVPHVDDTQPALSRAHQDIVEVIANEGENLTNPMTLDGVDKELRACFHSVIIITHTEPRLPRSGPGAVLVTTPG